MKKKTFILIGILVLLLSLSAIVFSSCSSSETETTVLYLNSESFFYSDLFNGMIGWDPVDGASGYSVSLYPASIASRCIYSTEIASEPGEQIVLLSSVKNDFSDWQELIVKVYAYDSTRTHYSNVVAYQLSFIKEEMPIVIKEDVEEGVVEEFEDKQYYYSHLDENTNIRKNDSLDYAFLLDSEVPVSSVTAVGIDGFYSYDSEKNLLIIDKEYIDYFSECAHFPVEILYEDGSYYRFILSIVSQMPYSLDTTEISFKRGGCSSSVSAAAETKIQDVYFKDAVCTVTLDGVIAKKDLYYTNYQFEGITFNKDALNNLSLGTHEIRVYYYLDDHKKSLGYSSINVIVNESDSYAPYNLEIDYDSNFPSVYVKWDCDRKWNKAEVKIGTNVYLSIDSTHARLFDGNSFNAMGILRRKDTAVQVVLYYGDGFYYSASTTLEEDLASATVQSYLLDTVSYLGQNCNAYITSDQELLDYCGYKIIHYGDSDIYRETECDVTETYNIYSPYLNQKYPDNSDLKSAVSNAFYDFIEQLTFYNSKLIVVRDEDNSNKISITMTLRSGSARPYTTYKSFDSSVKDVNKTSKYKEYTGSVLHYYTNGESQRDSSYEFKVDSVEKTATVSETVELVLALENGYNPECVPNSNAEKVYLKARSILREIIDDRMSDYEKVLAIYDWVTYNCIYDYAIIAYSGTIKNSSAYAAIYKNRAFYPEGVFFDGIAVCNGIASAFSIMCNIEGIRCYKIIGEVSSGPHAWVKVYVDSNWYVCDPTWSNARRSIGNQYYEYITYDFFMMGQEESESYQDRYEYKKGEGIKYHAGNSEYSYWSSMFFTYEDKVYDYYFDNYNDFVIFMDYYTQRGENAVVQGNNEIMVSFMLKSGASSLLADNWYENYVSEHNPEAEIYFNINFSNRVSSPNGGKILNFSNIVYLRISKQ